MGMDVSGNNPKINKGKDHYKMYFKWDNIDWNARENEKNEEWEKEKDLFYSEYDKYHEDNKGVYFRNNCWWWRPLWDFCHHIAPELIDEELWDSGHHNDGAGLNEEDSAKLSVKLMVSVEDGTAEMYEDEVKLINEQKEADGDNFTYPFSVENVKRFATFCLESGGFSIY